jgi:hypothetical protein
MAKQIASKESVAGIFDDNLDYYDDLIESKSKNKPKQNDVLRIDSTDPKNQKDLEMLKKRNEQLMQLMLEFENENKLMQKGLVEVRDQIKDLNNPLTMSQTKKTLRKPAQDVVIKCPSLDKLLNVQIFFVLRF